MTESDPPFDPDAQLAEATAALRRRCNELVLPGDLEAPFAANLIARLERLLADVPPERRVVKLARAAEYSPASRAYEDTSPKARDLMDAYNAVLRPIKEAATKQLTDGRTTPTLPEGARWYSQAAPEVLASAGGRSSGDGRRFVLHRQRNTPYAFLAVDLESSSVTLFQREGVATHCPEIESIDAIAATIRLRDGTLLRRRWDEFIWRSMKEAEV